MGMADTMPELRSALADFTNFCHKNTLHPAPAEQQNSTLAGSLRVQQQNDLGLRPSIDTLSPQAVS
jgi:hypothetical protein